MMLDLMRTKERPSACLQKQRTKPDVDVAQVVEEIEVVPVVQVLAVKDVAHPAVQVVAEDQAEDKSWP